MRCTRASASSHSCDPLKTCCVAFVFAYRFPNNGQQKRSSQSGLAVLTGRDWHQRVNLGLLSACCLWTCIIFWSKWGKMRTIHTICWRQNISWKCVWLIKVKGPTLLLSLVYSFPCLINNFFIKMNPSRILCDSKEKIIKSKKEHFQLLFRLFAHRVSGKAFSIIPPTPHLYDCLSPLNLDYCISHSCALLWHLLMYCKWHKIWLA